MFNRVFSLFSSPFQIIFKFERVTENYPTRNSQRGMKSICVLNILLGEYKLNCYVVIKVKRG